MTKKELIKAINDNRDWKDGEDKTCICIIGDNKHGQNLFSGSVDIGINALEAAMENNTTIERIVENANSAHTFRKYEETFKQ